jgi:hypothetical protein
MFQSWRSLVGRCALCAALAAPFIGAVSSASAQDAFIEIDAAPRGYAERPHTRYRGDDVYYVDGRWYARHGRRWHYYREEPRELVRYRDRDREVVRAPRAPHRHYHERRVVEVR